MKTRSGWIRGGWFGLMLVLGALITAPTAGQTPYLVKDIDPGFPAHAGATTDALPLGSTAGKAFFWVQRSFSDQVWVSDGTPAGTRVIADPCGGDCERIGPLDSPPGILFFAAGSFAEARLWQTDGTPGGTYPLPDQLRVSSDPIAPGGRLPGELLGKVLYLQACGAVDGCGLWRTDGTPGGTRLVKNVSGTDPVASAGKLFFASSDGLWVSDGSTTGTRLVSGAASGSSVAAAGGKFFVVSGLGSASYQLWATDGTAAGTRQLTSFPAGTLDHSTPLYPLGSSIYFVVDDGMVGQELWRSDGTLGGTSRVTNLSDPEAFSGSPLLIALASDGKLYFVANDHSGTRKLWVSTGTLAGTEAIVDGCPGGCPRPDERGPLLAIGKRVVFPDYGVFDVWASDGTPQGTRRLAERCASCGDFPPRGMGVYLNRVFFWLSRNQGPELWSTDGTAAGTRAATAFQDPRSMPSAGLVAASAGSRLVFAANPGDRAQLFATRGSPPNTRLLTALDKTSGADGNPGPIVAAGGRAVFTACHGGYTRLWQSDGSTPGTAAIPWPWGPICSPSNAPSELVVIGDRVYGSLSSLVWGFDVSTGTVTELRRFPFGEIADLVPLAGHLMFLFERELWISDGTPGNTFSFFNLPADSFVTGWPDEELQSAAGKLFFSVERAGVIELWRSDGTAEGTQPIGDLPARAREFVTFGGKAYFLSGGSLWASDGTAGGTTEVFQAPGSVQGDDLELIVTGGALYFSSVSASEPGHWALWRSNGQLGGAVEVAVFGAVEPPTSLTPFGTGLYFVADDGVHGRELWRSGGTAAVTLQVRDIYAGLESSDPRELTAFAGGLYFTVNGPLHGYELWTSDGTPAGTRLVQDIFPGAPSSQPLHLEPVGNLLFFSADDGLHGRELWALPAAGSNCVPSDIALCLQGGRFRVEAFWRDFEGRTGAGHARLLTADTGYFWFFRPENVEVVLKTLDGRGANGHFWVFYGALSSVEYILTVTDTQSGASRRYYNPPRNLASVADTSSFGPLGALARAAREAQLAPVGRGLAIVEKRVAPATGPCVPGPERLCLQQGRFSVTATWKDFENRTGTGKTKVITSDTGLFWFFRPENVEVVIKVLDGRATNGKFWVFYGALSSVEYRLTVTDTQTGVERVYANKRGELASVADTSAF